MNRYDVIDFEKNEILSIQEIETDFEINETGTSSVSCTDKIDLLQEIIKNTIETINTRANDVERYHLAMYLLREAFLNLNNQQWTNEQDFNKILDNKNYPFGQSFDEMTSAVNGWWWDNCDIIERTATNED